MLVWPQWVATGIWHQHEMIWWNQHKRISDEHSIHMKLFRITEAVQKNLCATNSTICIIVISWFTPCYLLCYIYSLNQHLRIHLQYIDQFDMVFKSIYSFDIRLIRPHMLGPSVATEPWLGKNRIIHSLCNEALTWDWQETRGLHMKPEVYIFWHQYLRFQISTYKFLGFRFVGYIYIYIPHKA